MLGLKITILGSGDTPGTPALYCHCRTCENAREHPEHARTRFSLLIQSDEGKNILIDASPDIRAQLLRAGVERIHAIFLTHEHFDHASGLFNFYRYPVRASEKIHLYGGQDVIDYLITNKLQKVLPFRRRPLDLYGQVSYAGIEFQSFHVKHFSRNEDIAARGYLLTYKGKRIVIMGDSAPNVPEETLKFISISPDYLFINCFTDRNVDFLQDKHFILSEALDFSRRIGAKKVFLVHLSHYTPPHPEFVAQMRAHGEQYNVGYDGLQIEI